MRTRTNQEEYLVAKCQKCGEMFPLLVGATEKETQGVIREAIDLHSQNALKCASCVFRELGFELDNTPN